MKRINNFFTLFMVGLALVFSGCATSPDPATVRGDVFKNLKAFPDHSFNAKEYVEGMKKGGHKLLIWKDASVDFSKYNSLNLTDFNGRLLPDQNEFSYTPYIKQFNSDFGKSFAIRTNDPKGLRVEGGVVELNKGLPNAQSILRTGSDKTYAGVACEIYEPGGSVPVMRLFTRDCANGGYWGEGEDSMMNHILKTLASRLSKKIDRQVGM